MHTNAKNDTLVERNAHIRFGQCGLRFYGALNGIHCTPELGKNTVACGVEDAASVRRDQPIDDRAAGPQAGDHRPPRAELAAAQRQRTDSRSPITDRA